MSNHPHLKIRQFTDFRDAVLAFRLPRVLLSALELDVFSVMGRRSWTAKALARALSADERALDILCRNLASVGLLRKNGMRYQTSRVSRIFLDRRGPDGKGDYLDLLIRQWNAWDQLTQALRSGKPVDADEPETPEYRRAFSWAMHQRSIEPARAVARQLRLGQARSLLDLGGGPGTYALAFLAQYPRLQATLMDRPAALEVAKAIAHSAKGGSRLSYYSLDFFRDPIPGTYDVIWLSNVIHIYSPQENLRLFKTLRANMNPHGKIYIQDTFLLDKEGLSPLETNLFAVTMLLCTETGNTYKAATVRKWLKMAGFRPGRLIKLAEGTGDWEGVLVQASSP